MYTKDLTHYLHTNLPIYMFKLVPLRLNTYHTLLKGGVP